MPDGSLKCLNSYVSHRQRFPGFLLSLRATKYNILHFKTFASKFLQNDLNFKYLLLN